MPPTTPRSFLRARRRLEIVLSFLGLLLTAGLILALAIDLAVVGTGLGSAAVPLWARLKFAVFSAVIVGLAYGLVVYLLARLGHFLRSPAGDERTPVCLGLADPMPSAPVTMLVPSYKENAETIRQTLMSAGLQDYTRRRVVLLIDDPPSPSDASDTARLASARDLPHRLNALMSRPLADAKRAMATFRERAEREFDPEVELAELETSMRLAIVWFRALSAEEAGEDHTTRLFRELVLDGHADLILTVMGELRETPALDAESTMRAYAWLVAQFDVEYSSFERKSFVNLSHEANKAANLNSYLDHLGATVKQMATDEGLALLRCEPDSPGAYTVPDATYVVTLDADSLVAPQYTRRLVAIMERPENDRMAVAQTPYSAIPGASSVLERAAGATTDIQFIVHQGFTWIGATFWVGANAVLRKRALDDIRTVEIERGYEIAKIIQDRTVIEDTESSIDLIHRGWSLHNEPARLAFSATPPDFGSLLIQRRRWANGGLLILPKLVAYAFKRRWTFARPIELFLRAHYLGSLSLANVGLLTLLLLPIDRAYVSPPLMLVGVPYTLLYWRDLRILGYRRLDMLRVYALNWLLLPVNLAGVLKSLHQGITGAKIPFGRTPKVAGRTRAPAWSVTALWMLLAYAVIVAVRKAMSEEWVPLVFAAGTSLALGYALVAFVGLRSGLADIEHGWRAFSGDVAQRLAATPLRARLDPEQRARRRAAVSSSDDVATGRPS